MPHGPRLGSNKRYPAGDDEAEPPAPIFTHFAHAEGAAADELIGTEDVTGNLEEICQAVRHLLDHSGAEVIDVEVDPSRATGAGADVEPQHLLFSPTTLWRDPAAENQRLRHAHRAWRASHHAAC